MKTIWDKYHYDRQIIDEFLEAFEIKVEGFSEQINWKNTLSKILVWDGFNMDLKFDYTDLILNRKSGIFKSAAKWLINKKKAYKYNSNKPWPEVLHQCTHLFFLMNKGEIEVLLPLLKSLQHKAKLALVYEHDDTKDQCDGWPLFKLNTINIRHKKIKVIPKKTPSNKALFVFNALLREKNQLQDYAVFFKNLKAKNQHLQKIIFVAGENKYVANFCYQIFKDSNVKLENLMNGAKYGWPNDADVDFNTWYVWNDKMKTFLVNNAKVNPDILKVVGHPLEDLYNRHVYTGENRLLNNLKLQHEQIFALFTTSLKFENKLILYKKVIEFVKENPKIGLIIKAHPSDKETSFFDKYKFCSQVIIFEGFSKQLLADIICSSSLTISFGSTISFESIWLGVPNISFEEFEETQLPIESDIFFHLNDLSKFKELLKKKTKKSNKIGLRDNLEVTREYVDSILSL